MHVEVERLYAGMEQDLDFSALLAAAAYARNDEAEDGLAELIEADGRWRLRKGRAVTLERYLHAVPDLTERTDALDAAIDVALRGMSGSSRIVPEAVEGLAAQHPHLEEMIREAAVLNAALWSTTGLRHRLSSRPAKTLPCDFGPALPSGQRRYLLLELLGQGAFGQVYKAEDRQLSEEGHPAIVAIKILSAAERTAQDRHRIIEEATKARRISHPNVVQPLDRGITDDDEDFIVYEYVAGGDLSDLRKDRLPMPPAAAAALVAQIARGVHAAHAAGLIHCDLKPSNVMLASDGQPKVADFGIAVRMDDDRRTAQLGSGSASSRGPIGNIAFISPEQYRQEDTGFSVPSDVYALGGILFHLLTDRLPNGSTREEIARTHDARDGRRMPPSPRVLAPAVDRDLDAICRRSLAASPEERHDSAAALAEDLERWGRREPITWLRPSPLRRMRLWSYRKPALAAATAAIILLAVGGAAVGWKAAVAKAEADAGAKLQATQNQVKTVVIAALSQLKTADKERFLTDMLVQTWVFGFVFGPTALDDPPRAKEVWARRIDAVQQMIDTRRANGLGDAMETLLWEDALAFWLVSDGDYARAMPLLDRNIAQWRAWPKHDDPWLADSETIRLCAEVNRARDRTVMDAMTPNERSKAMNDLLDSLRKANERIAILRPRSPLHFLVLNHMADVYDALDPERGKSARIQIKKMLDDSQPTVMGVSDKARATTQAAGKP